MSHNRTHPTPSPELNPGAGLTERTVELPDGRRMRTILAGDADGPLIVLEAGMSAPAACWAHTQRELSAHARTLSYDRAGYGGSDVDPADRTLERLADDLASLLDAVGETAPVILVGHSWGGPIIRRFADQHPERVAGLVLVDGTVAEMMTPGIIRANLASFRLNALLARLGRTTTIVRMILPHGFANVIGPEDQAILARDYASVSAMKAGRREALQIRAAVPLLEHLQVAGTPDVPTVSVQGSRIDPGMKEKRPRWNAIVQKLMAAAPRGRTIVVENAGHMIPQEQPAAVHDAIVDVLALVRRSSDPQAAPESRQQ